MDKIDLNDPRNCVVNLVKKIKRNMTRKSNQLMRDMGLSSGQFSLLTALYNHKGLKSVQLASVFEMEKSTVSRELKLLEKKGFIVYNKQSKGRGKEIIITPLGIDTYEKALHQWQKAQKHFIACIGEKNYESLLEISKLLQNTNF